MLSAAPAISFGAVADPVAQAETIDFDLDALLAMLGSNFDTLASQPAMDTPSEYALFGGQIWGTVPHLPDPNTFDLEPTFIFADDADPMLPAEKPALAPIEADEIFEYDAATGAFRLSARFLSATVAQPAAATQPACPGALTPESMGSPTSGEVEGYYSPAQSYASLGEDFAFDPAFDLPSPPVSHASDWDELQLPSSRASPFQGTVDVSEILGKRTREEPAAEADANGQKDNEGPASPVRRQPRPRLRTEPDEQYQPPATKRKPAPKRYPSPVSPVEQPEVDQEEAQSEDDGEFHAASSSARPHACREPGCSLRFRRKYNRDAHETTHSGTRPYVCGARCPTTLEVCTESFARSYDAKRHKTTVHNHKRGEIKKRCVCGSGK
jgi:hypothetical protein